MAEPKCSKRMVDSEIMSTVGVVFDKSNDKRTDNYVRKKYAEEDNVVGVHCKNIKGFMENT